MKKIFLLSFLTVLIGAAGAQTPNWLWAESGPGSGYGYCSGLALAPNDTLYIAGRIGGTVTLGGLSLNGGTVPFVGKYDTSDYYNTNNNGIWLSSNYPISGFAYSDGLCVDHSGNSYITSCDGSGNGVFIEGFNNAGSLMWDFDTNNSNCRGYGVCADNLGNLYTSGMYGGYSGQAITFGATTLPYGGSAWAGYLTKQDAATGDFKWATYYSSTGGSNNNYTVGRRCVTDNMGNVYIVGAYQDVATFYSASGGTTISTPTSTATGAFSDLFVAKYDSSGTIQWVITVPNAGLDYNMYWYASVITIDSCNNLYIGGLFQNTATFGSLPPVTNSTGNLSAFVAKFNTGAMVWEWVQTGIGTGGDCYLGSIALDKTSDVYVTGPFTNSATFGSTSLSSGNNYVAKYSNSSGALQWIQTANLVGGGFGGVVVDNQNYTYVSGSFGGNSTLGSTTLTGGGGSVFLAKLDTIPPRTIVPQVDSNYCPGETTSLPYTIQGTFNGGNTFTAQLSDSVGTFVNPTQLGQVTSTSSGTITITIPPGIPAGTYLIRIISSNPATSSWANGCGAYYSQNVYTNNFYITIGSNSSLSISASADTICAGGAITLIASGGTSYMWSNGAATDTIVVNPTTDTTIAVSSTGGCSGSASIQLTVNSIIPLIVSPPSPVVACSGQPTVLTVPASGTDYTWSPAVGLTATTGSSVTASPTASVTYTVTGIDSLGCTTTGIEIIDVQFGPNKPIIKLSVTGDTLFSSARNGNQWFLNGKPIHGADDSIYVITGVAVGDSITVAVTDVANGCSTTSDAFITGINQVSFINNQLSIYPNPTNGLLTVTISASATDIKDWNLRVIDVVGRTLYTRSSLTYNNEIDLSALPGGVYFITVINKTGSAVVPVVKQN